MEHAATRHAAYERTSGETGDVYEEGVVELFAVFWGEEVVDYVL